MDGRGSVATDGLWGGVATDGQKVLQQRGEVRRERCNRTLQYFTVDGLP